MTVYIYMCVCVCVCVCVCLRVCMCVLYVSLFVYVCDKVAVIPSSRCFVLVVEMFSLPKLLR